MKICLLATAFALLAAGCAEVPEMDESQPVATYHGPISGPMSGNPDPRRPGTLGGLNALSPGGEDAGPDDGTEPR